MDRLIPAWLLKGQVTLYRVHEERLPGDSELSYFWDWNNPLYTTPNAICYDWAGILVKNLCNRPDGKSWHINAMYIEFDNSGSAPTPPTATRGGSVDYYASLNDTDPNQDYLRVPVIATRLDNTDSTLFLVDNRARFFAQTETKTGVNGLTCGLGSYVYGASLVACPEYDDPSQDVIFSRTYFTTENQIVVAQNSQIGLSWDITGE
jgi:hypothetical protein